MSSFPLNNLPAEMLTEMSLYLSTYAFEDLQRTSKEMRKILEYAAKKRKEVSVIQSDLQVWRKVSADLAKSCDAWFPDDEAPPTGAGVRKMIIGSYFIRHIIDTIQYETRKSMVLIARKRCQNIFEMILSFLEHQWALIIGISDQDPAIAAKNFFLVFFFDHLHTLMDDNKRWGIEEYRTAAHLHIRSRLTEIVTDHTYPFDQCVPRYNYGFNAARTWMSLVKRSECKEDPGIERAFYRAGLIKETTHSYDEYVRKFVQQTDF
ncbi:uncharacterized protein EV422DRAFT_506276 [Fimicolochytrium jonesii]|uniref:uncharacterized protein n=1 Tax=Fimicolochytrium jonesii TaxID=1396493 RepID=UPI0022FF299E|nr:uncharacterized protein EV422DRAFT_506276 [Fimicolochytrium jonesii]KAI8821058.1 hypothetical protein EV422DRAFT_506276 [Fimicolochytrium jonesii]